MLGIRRALLLQGDSFGGEHLLYWGHLGERRYFEQDPSRVGNVDVFGESLIIPVLVRPAVIEIVLVFQAALEDGGIDLNTICDKKLCRYPGGLQQPISDPEIEGVEAERSKNLPEIDDGAIGDLVDPSRGKTT